MCYNLESSLSAWVIATSIALYLFYRNKNYDRWNSAFIVTFTTIQLLEAGIWWTYEEGEKNPINQILTKLILLTLLAQPLVQTYMGAKYTKSDTLQFLSYIYISIFLWGLFRIFKSSSGQFYTSKNKNENLVWHDSKSENNFLGGSNPVISKIVPVLYLGGLFVPLLFAKDFRGLPLFITGMITLIYSASLKGNAFGSLWCYYAVIYAVVAIFV